MLDERPGGAATTRCAAGVRLRRSTPRFHTLATTHGSALALGCACRPGPCTRASARGGRRVGSVAGHDAAAAGVSRRDGTSTCTHDLLKSRVEARISITTCAPSPNARPTPERRHGQNGNPQTRRALGPRARWRGATRDRAHCPCKSTWLDGRTHTSTASHGDSGAQEHRRLRSSRWRGVATLRRDGQISNMVHDVASRRRGITGQTKGKGKEEKGRGDAHGGATV
jgi:hypothetical protein